MRLWINFRVADHGRVVEVFCHHEADAVLVPHMQFERIDRLPSQGIASNRCERVEVGLPDHAATAL
jgi:hypothetical protein